MQVVESMVNGIEQVDERVRVHSAQAMVEGDVCCASAGLRLPAPDAWQSFEGHEVVLAGDLPDTRTATFMDFRTDQGHDVRFFHVLPLGPRRVFVEHRSAHHSDHREAITRYLTQVLEVKPVALLDSAQGRTPLYRQPPTAPAPRIRPIGVHGGLARPCSGFALMRMWRDAGFLAQALEAGALPPPPHVPGPLDRIAEGFVLDLLARAPHRVAGLYELLFARAGTEAVLDFLEDGATTREQLDVALAVPDWHTWLTTLVFDQ